MVWNYQTALRLVPSPSLSSLVWYQTKVKSPGKIKADWHRFSLLSFRLESGLINLHSCLCVVGTLRETQSDPIVFATVARPT